MKPTNQPSIDGVVAEGNSEYRIKLLSPSSTITTQYTPSNNTHCQEKVSVAGEVDTSYHLRSRLVISEVMIRQIQSDIDEMKRISDTNRSDNEAFDFNPLSQRIPVKQKRLESIKHILACVRKQ